MVVRITQNKKKHLSKSKDNQEKKYIIRNIDKCKKKIQIAEDDMKFAIRLPKILFRILSEQI